MDKQQLLGYFQNHYLSRQDVLFKLPLNISIESFWQDLVNQRKARATMLPLYSATGQPYWYVTTDKMVKASERLCEEAMKHDAFFDPYRIPLSQSLTYALSQEAYFTSFVEGADYSIQAAVEFLRRGSEPENAYEQNIMNNYQAGSYLLSALSIPFDEDFVKELAATLTDGQSGYRTTDVPSIPAMEGEPFTVPPGHLLPDRMNRFYAFLADVRVHPLIKAAVGQAYILTTRPFPEANERLGRLISTAVLLRYGYDYFLDISISAYIARESFRYFKAMREIICSDNEGDLTYFVEYYLELLVRALDGTRMEEAERQQSQLEAERKMALQPLKQPTVQYTQPHTFNAEAIARAIDNAESDQDAEDSDYAAKEDGVDSDGGAPDPPDLIGGDASYRASQSQAGSTQGDRKGPQIEKGALREKADPALAPSGGARPLSKDENDGQRISFFQGRGEDSDGHQAFLSQQSGGVDSIQEGDFVLNPYDFTCPQLLGLSNEMMTHVGKMLDQGISPFLASHWADIMGMTPKEAAMECRNLSILRIASRTYSDHSYSYTFRFNGEEYNSALSTIASAGNSGNWEKMLTIIEMSDIQYNKQAVSFIRHCCREGITEFYISEMRNWSSMPKADVRAAIKILEERRVIQKPGDGKYRIMVPLDDRSGDGSEGELLQAVVASQGQNIAPALAEKLSELKMSGSAAEKRIGEYIPQFLAKGKVGLTYVDWMKATKMSVSMANSDLNTLANLGLARRIKSDNCRYPCVFMLIMEPGTDICWDDLTPKTMKVLDSIVRSFGTESFTLQALAPLTGIGEKNLPVYTKILRMRSIINTDSPTQQKNKEYYLAVPIEEAIEHLRESGFDYIALVG